MIFNDHRPRLQRLKHAANANPAGQMHILADLRARADRRPGIDHRALINISAQINKGWHQHHTRRNVGRAADHTAWHRPEPRILKLSIAPAIELAGNLVPPNRLARTMLNHRHVKQAERQQHRLFQPLIDHPAIRRLLRHAKTAIIHARKRGHHSITHLALGGC